MMSTAKPVAVALSLLSGADPISRGAAHAVEMRVAAQPSPGIVGDDARLAYELHLANLGDAPLTPTSLTTESDRGVRLAALDGAGLAVADARVAAARDGMPKAPPFRAISPTRSTPPPGTMSGSRFRTDVSRSTNICGREASR